MGEEPLAPASYQQSEQAPYDYSYETSLGASYGASYGEEDRKDSSWTDRQQRK